MSGPGSVLDSIYSLFIMMNKKTYILLRIEFLVVVVTVLFLAMSIMDIFRRRFHSPLLKSIFNIMDTVSDSIVLYILGAMKTAPIKNQLFPVWAIVLVNFRNSIDFISGFGVPDRRGRRFTEWRNVVKLLGVGFLNGSSDSKFLLPLWSLWSLQILRSFYRFQTRNLAVQSMWHGHSSSLISEYMRADREHGNFRATECNPQTMEGYKYLVYGETKRRVTLKKPQYVLRIGPRNQQRRKRSNTSSIGSLDTHTLTTLDKIWLCDGDLLCNDNSRGENLKDLSLAFALYRLLRCRLEDVPLHEDAIRVNQKLIRGRIAIVGEKNDRRIFRVMELQLGFLNDYFNTRYPMVFWCGLPSLFISLMLSLMTFAVVCWLSVDIRRVIKPPAGDTTHHVHGFNVEVSITWAFMFFMIFKEIWEIVTYLLSDWTRLLLTCLYQRWCKYKCVRNSFAEGIILSFFKSKITSERWHGAIDQYILLQSYDSKPRFWNLLHKLTLGTVEKKDEGAELGDAIGIPDCLQPAILDRLRSLNLSHGGYLAKTITSLPENGPRMKYREACLKLPTCSHVILVWHIATSLCEIELAKGHLPKPGFLRNLLSCFTKCCSSKSYLMDENKLSGKLQECYVIANSLSRYCAYLLVSKPELIPDSFLVPKMVLQETIKHARDRILKDNDSLQSRYDKLIEEAKNAPKEVKAERGDVLQQGAILGYQLISSESEEERWVILSEVWAELIVHLAPSWNAAAHKKSLESGGEFITHIWALLWHCGITNSKLWPVEDVADDKNASDNAENGSDQTKQTDAKIGGKEEVDTSKSDLMQGAAGAQVQNGKVENGVHGKDGINVIIQTHFVERADVDVTLWIDHQPEEDTEEQKQVVVLGRKTHAEDAGEVIASVQSEDIVTGRAMPLPHHNVVRGMKNLENTCYFNAVLQSLLALGSMRVNMLESEAPKGSLGQELKNLFIETTYGSNVDSIPVVPKNLFNIMCSRNSRFQRGVADDSNTMLISLLDGLNDEEPGMVESLFYGQVGKNLRCKACGHATYIDGEKLHLSVAIPSKKLVSVEDCLDLYAQANIEDWLCTDCFPAAGNGSTKQTEQSNSGTLLKVSVPDNNEEEHQMEPTQKVENKICRTVARDPNQITKAPPVLIIQLKRFKCEASAQHDNHKIEKLGETVIFEETLDITKFMHPRHTENEYYKYRLVAVIVHEGETLDAGHYIAFVRASRIGCQQQVSGDASTWFRVSDEHVRDASLEDVLESQAYILFYERLKQPNANTSLETHCISPWVVAQTDKSRRAFLWRGTTSVAGGQCKVAWRTVCSPLVYGGLGILDLRFFGFALKLRWEWLRRRTELLPSRREPRGKAMLSYSVTVIIGDGKSAIFWSDIWLPEGPLERVAPALARVITRTGRSRTVCEALTERKWVRDISAAGALTTQVLCDYIRVWELVDDFVLQPLIPDRFVWKWSSDGVYYYSASSTYRAFFSGSWLLDGAQELWKVSAPPEVKFFFWLSLHGRLWTADHRRRHNLQDGAQCALCANIVETADHMLAGCIFSRELWARIFHGLRLAVPVPQMDTQLLRWWLDCRQELSSEMRKGFDSLVLLVTWSLWRERNRRVFTGVAKQPMELLHLIREEGSAWLQAGYKSMAVLLAASSAL